MILVSLALLIKNIIIVVICGLVTGKRTVGALNTYLKSKK